MVALSILLPTYNGARFLREQVESIVAQSFAEWELIVCDDGSSDATPQLLEALAREDPRIRLLPAAGNLGQKRRLRDLAGAAAGELIAVADQDDIWEVDKLRLLVDALGAADIAFGASWLIDAEGRPLDRTLLDNFTPPLAPDDRLTYLFRPAVSAHAMVARRALMEGAALSRDRPFDWLLSLEAVFGNGLVFEPAAKTLHRMHDANQMNGAHVERRRAPKLFSLAEARYKYAGAVERRLNFLGHVEHLAYSTLVPEEIATRFAQVHRLCHAAWFDHRRPLHWDAADLRAQLAQLLRPLAGSERDWAYAWQSIQSLTRYVFHPHAVLGHLRRAALPVAMRLPHADRAR